MTDLNEIVDDLNVSICDIETLKLENPDSLDLQRAVGQIKAARASVCAFKGKFNSPKKTITVQSSNHPPTYNSGEEVGE